MAHARLGETMEYKTKEMKAGTPEIKVETPVEAKYYIAEKRGSWFVYTLEGKRVAKLQTEDDANNYVNQH